MQKQKAINQSNESKEKKGKIMPVLKKMKQYDSADFPSSRYTVVNAAIQRIQTEYHGKRFTQKKNNETLTIRVTRTA